MTHYQSLGISSCLELRERKNSLHFTNQRMRSNQVKLMHTLSIKVRLAIRSVHIIVKIM